MTKFERNCFLLFGIWKDLSSSQIKCLDPPLITNEIMLEVVACSTVVLVIQKNLWRLVSIYIRNASGSAVDSSRRCRDNCRRDLLCGQIGLCSYRLSPSGGLRHYLGLNDIKNAFAYDVLGILMLIQLFFWHVEAPPWTLIDEYKRCTGTGSR